MPSFVNGTHATRSQFFFQLVLSELIGSERRALQCPLLTSNEEHRHKNAKSRNPEQHHERAESATQNVNRLECFIGIDFCGNAEVIITQPTPSADFLDTAIAAI